MWVQQSSIVIIHILICIQLHHEHYIWLKTFIGQKHHRKPLQFTGKYMMAFIDIVHAYIVTVVTSVPISMHVCRNTWSAGAVETWQPFDLPTPSIPEGCTICPSDRARDRDARRNNGECWAAISGIYSGCHRDWMWWGKGRVRKLYLLPGLMITYLLPTTKPMYTCKHLDYIWNL